MEQRLYYSTDIAKRLETKHSGVRVSIESIIADIDRIKVSKSPINFLCDDFFYEKIINEYRNQKYTAYKINKAFLLLLLGRIKGGKAFDLKLTLVAGLIICEEELSKLTPIDKVFLMSHVFNQSYPEAEFIRRILGEWDNVFPEYELLEQEVLLPDGDRIDILAKTKDNTPVIIEVKPYPKSAHKQLRSYAVHYTNPILVNITPTIPKNKVDDIIYVVLPFSKTKDVDSESIFSDKLDDMEGRPWWK